MLSDSTEELNLSFVGIPSFLRSPVHTDLKNLDADIAFLGNPSDEGSPWYPGARMAPRMVREMSACSAADTHHRRRA